MTTFPTKNPITATVDVLCGDIRVTASDRSDCVVNVAPRDPTNPADVRAAGEATVDLRNDVLVVQSKKPWGRVIGPRSKSGTIHVDVEVPSLSVLKASTGLGSVHTDGDLAATNVKSALGYIHLDNVGPLAAKTGQGDVVVAAISGDASVSTGTGSVQLGEVGGSATVRNSTGSIAVGDCLGDLHVRTAGGAITVGRAHASVTAVTAGGDIHISEVSTGSISARSAAGAIDIGVREGTAAWLEARAKFGSVRNGLTETSGPEGAQSTVEVRAATGVGDITITRATD